MARRRAVDVWRGSGSSTRGDARASRGLRGVALGAWFFTLLIGSLLPQGGGENHTISCVCYVLDKYGAGARTAVDVTVGPAVMEASELAAAASMLHAARVSQAVVLTEVR